MKIGIPIVHTSVKIFRLIHKNFTVLAKVQKSKEKERKEKKKTVQTKSIGKSPFRSVPIRRINILEKRDSIPGIGSNRFFSCFFKVTATFQRDRPSLLDPIRFSTCIYIYTHLIHLNAISIFPRIELFGMSRDRWARKECSLRLDYPADGKWNRGTRVGSEISRSQMKRVTGHAVRFESPLPFEPIYITSGRRFRSMFRNDS